MAAVQLLKEFHQNQIKMYEFWVTKVSLTTLVMFGFSVVAWNLKIKNSGNSQTISIQIPNHLRIARRLNWIWIWFVNANVIAKQIEKKKIDSFSQVQSYCWLACKRITMKKKSGSTNVMVPSNMACVRYVSGFNFETFDRLCQMQRFTLNDFRWFEHWTLVLMKSISLACFRLHFYTNSIHRECSEWESTFELICILSTNLVKTLQIRNCMS